MSSRFRPNHRRARLNCENLEPREVPTGNVTAEMVGGALNLTGDEFNNVVTVEIAGGSVKITPDGTTTVNGLMPGVADTIMTVPTSLKAKLFAGNDALSIASGVDFILPGGANVDLGDGINSMNFTTSAKIELGSLVVRGGDGADVVTVVAGAGLGKVTGKAAFDYGVGDNNTTLTEIQFTGSSGLRIKDSGGGLMGAGNSFLALTKVSVTKAVKITQNTFGGAGIINSSLGGLTEKGLVQTISMTGTTITGNASMNNVYQSVLSANGAIFQGNVKIRSNGSVVTALNGNTSVSGNITLISKAGTQLMAAGISTDTLNVTGNVSLKAVTTTSLSTVAGGPAISAKNLSLRGAQITFAMAGKALTVNGNLSIVGSVFTQTDFLTTDVSTVKGNLSVTGGWFADRFTTTSQFKVDKNMTLNLKGGSNNVVLGDGTAAVPVLGKLTLNTGIGNDIIQLRNVAVTGTTKVKTGAGFDTLNIPSASAFTGAFSTDLGAGNDTVAIAQVSGSAVPVTFTGKATFLTGIGNDILNMGVAAGDAGQKVVFVAAGSKIDGGADFNSFDDELGSFAGIALGTGIVNWTDPT